MRKGKLTFHTPTTLAPVVEGRHVACGWIRRRATFLATAWITVVHIAAAHTDKPTHMHSSNKAATSTTRPDVDWMYIYEVECSTMRAEGERFRHVRVFVCGFLCVVYVRVRRKAESENGSGLH